jgi:hemolysin III
MTRAAMGRNFRMARHTKPAGKFPQDLNRLRDQRDFVAMQYWLVTLVAATFCPSSAFLLCPRKFGWSRHCAHDIGATGAEGVSVSVAATLTVPRPPSRRELVADCIIHILGIAAGSIGGATLVALIAMRGDWLELGALLIYACGMIAMFCCSAAYNLARNSRWRALLRRCDHAAIFIMIAGTYTPFTLLRLDGAWSWGLTGAVWLIAAIGVLMKLSPRCDLNLASATPYLVFGWVGVIGIDPLFRSLSYETLALIGLGGALYTIGVLFHIRERLPFQNAIWHAFVLAAASAHYAAVVQGVVLRGA